MTMGQTPSELFAAHRLDALSSPAGLPLFVGRERELQTLHAAFESTLEGSGRGCPVRGHRALGQVL
jgi:hypothetical protein